MAVCLTLHLYIIRPAACKKKKKKRFDAHNGIPTRPGMLYNELCIAAIVQHHSRWQTEERMLRDPIITPRPDPASVSSIFRLHHYLFRADSSSVMGLIALWGCRRLHRSAAGKREAVSTDPGAQLLICRVFQHSTGQWPLREAWGPHITQTSLKHYCLIHIIHVAFEQRILSFYFPLLLLLVPVMSTCSQLIWNSARLHVIGPSWQNKPDFNANKISAFKE